MGGLCFRQRDLDSDRSLKWPHRTGKDSARREWSERRQGIKSGKIMMELIPVYERQCHYHCVGAQRTE